MPAKKGVYSKATMKFFGLKTEREAYLHQEISTLATIVATNNFAIMKMKQRNGITDPVNMKRVKEANEAIEARLNEIKDELEIEKIINELNEVTD
jgi:hypothetical protein